MIKFDNTYFISDIHGEYDKFMTLMDYINFNEDKNLFILGDICDRGPDSKKCYDYVVNKPNITSIMGNHEFVMLNSFHDRRFKYHWTDESFKGKTCIESYNYSVVDFFENFQKEYKNHYNYIKSMKSYEIVFDKVLLVHAGIRPNKPLRRQTKDDLLWIREDFYNNTRPSNEYLVMFGHTPTDFINNTQDGDIYCDISKIGIDTGAVFGGKMSLVKFNDICYDGYTLDVISLDKDGNIENSIVIVDR